MPLIPAIEKQREAGGSEFKTSPVYRLSSRTARAIATQRNHVLKKKKFLLPQATEIS